MQAVFETCFEISVMELLNPDFENSLTYGKLNFSSHFLQVFEVPL